MKILCLLPFLSSTLKLLINKKPKLIIMKKTVQSCLFIPLLYWNSQEASPEKQKLKN